MQQALTGVKSPTRILTASIRDIEDIAVLATQGLDTFTFSVAIAAAFFAVPATETATADFALTLSIPQVTLGILAALGHARNRKF